VLCRFFADQRFTFRFASKDAFGPFFRRFSRYIFCCILTLLLGMAVFHIALRLGCSPVLSKILSVPPVTASGYLLFRVAVFRRGAEDENAGWRLIACACLLALVFLCNSLLFIDTEPIHNWDEARHGVSAYEMLKSGNMIVNTFNGSPDYWNTKPPLSFWSVALGFIFCGFTPLGLRIASVLCSLISASMVVIFAGKRLSWPVGLLAAYFLITAGRFVTNHNVRTGDPDALYIMLCTGAGMAALNIKRRLFCVGATCFLLGLAFMAKGFHMLAPALCMGIVWLARYGINMLKPRWLLLCLLAFLLPVLPWGIARLLRTAGCFSRQCLKMIC
jgi:hypothetical protein